MKLLINFRSGVPIYRQLVQQIENGIVGGLLKPGDQLPTVREVALELTVNPNTVARAYRELEMRGLLQSIQGRGTYVSPSITVSRPAEKEVLLRRRLLDIMEEGRQLGVGPADLKKIFEKALQEWRKGGRGNG
ncbi:MAG: GntR family transcriptional regulator [Bacillota bacterium]|nr:GntR family transcriptional regulator [Bacillota bacterium]